MFKFISFFASLTVAIQAHAFVDISTGAYTQSWIDYEGKDLDIKIKLERTYNSRSSHKGWFGFGWCSDLETTLIVGEKSAIVNHCGDGVETYYEKKGSIYKTNHTSDGAIEKVGSHFVRTFSDGTSETFAQNGQLIEIRKKQEYLAIKYNDKGVIKQLVDGGGRIVSILSNSNGYVTDITFQSTNKDGTPLKQEVAQYVYKEDNLISAKNFWRNTYSYFYDKDQNLVKAVWPNNKNIELEYSSNDWVKSLKGTDVCSETYNYKVESSKTPPRYFIDVKKNCKEGTITERSYAYTYSLDRSRLVASEVDEEGLRREFMHDTNGHISEVIEHRFNGKVTTKITRNGKGQITKVSNPFEARTYSYKNGNGKDLTTELLIEEFADGKSLNKYSYTFSYDDQDRMISGTKPSGGTVRLKYDDNDRVSHISAKNTSIEVLYDGDKTEARGIKFATKELPLNIYEISASPDEVLAVELYFDFIRLKDLTIPSY